jgi:heme exporter protein D
MNWLLFGHYAGMVWAAVGPLIGVFIGAFLTNRTQRKQWLADRKREEYHQLMSTITAAYQEMFLLKNVDGLSMADFNRLNFNVHNAVQNCIFATDGVMTKFDVFNEWAKSVADAKEGAFDKIECGKKMGLLLEEIRRVALKDIGV